MKVDIWSDVVCPWCYVGKRRFEAALSRFAHADAVEVLWHSFELDPSAPRRAEGDYVGRMAGKYGLSRERAAAVVDEMTETAAAEGLEFRLREARGGSTLDAHRLIHLAHEAGLQDEMKERLLLAYFTEAQPIADPDTLVRLAAEVGLDPVDVRTMLDSDALTDEVRDDEMVARDLEITGVPFFVIDGRIGVPGAQPPDLLLRVLERAWETRAEPAAVVDAAGADGGSACADAICAV